MRHSDIECHSVVPRQGNLRQNVYEQEEPEGNGEK